MRGNHENKRVFFEKMRKKSGLTSLFQVVIIMIVFSLTGITVVMLRKSLFQWIGFDEQTAWSIKNDHLPVVYLSGLSTTHPDLRGAVWAISFFLEKKNLPGHWPALWQKTFKKLRKQAAIAEILRPVHFMLSSMISLLKK